MLGMLVNARTAELDLGDAMALLWVASGAAGLVGVVDVLRWLINGNAFLRPRIGALALLLGAVAAAVVAAGLAADSAMKLDGRIVLLGLFVVLPIASAAHLAYLARDYLLDRDKKVHGVAALRPGTVAADSAGRGRRSCKGVATAMAVASVVMNVVPRYGAPQFALSRLDSESMVWNFGWPLPVFIHDPSTGLHWGLGVLVMLPAQLLALAVLLIVAFWLPPGTLTAARLGPSIERRGER
jgi:hypothetical protein